MRLISSRLRNHFLFLLMATLLFSIGSYGQTGTTSLRGSLVDKSGGAVVGAIVKLDSTDLGVQRSTVWGSVGGMLLAEYLLEEC